MGAWNGNLLECDNVVARLDVCDAFAYALDNPAALMAEDYGEGTLWVLSGKRVGI
jgi:hypothetical protein